MSKRGISPLIATILLIAFAVALGAMLMNWGAGLVVSPKASDCYNVGFTLLSVSGDRAFCYDTAKERVFFRVKNNGTEPIKAVRYLMITQDETNDGDVPNSGIREGGVLGTTIAYRRTAAFHAELQPVIDDGGKNTVCPNAGIVVESLPDC